jgi:hypothetical protein
MNGNDIIRFWAGEMIESHPSGSWRAGVLYLVGSVHAHVIDLGTLKHYQITLREAKRADRVPTMRRGARLAVWLERRAKDAAKHHQSFNRAEVARACKELRK